MTKPRTKPDYCYDSGCPMAEKGTGFAVGCGDPKTAKLAIMLEALGSEEVLFRLAPEPGRGFYETKEECDHELAIRQRDYPDLPEQYLKRGVPVVGRSGWELVSWAFPSMGIKRSEILIDNSLRCLPPKKGESHYPDGPERKLAEAKCRHWDRWDNREGWLLTCNDCNSKILLYDDERRTNAEMSLLSSALSCSDNQRRSSQRDKQTAKNNQSETVLFGPLPLLQKDQQLPKSHSREMPELQTKIRDSGILARRPEGPNAKQVLQPAMSHKIRNQESEMAQGNSQTKPVSSSTRVSLPKPRWLRICKNESRISTRTQSKNGKEVGSEIEAIGEGSSSECNKVRQQASQSASGCGESALRQNKMPVLSEVFPNSIICSCGKSNFSFARHQTVGLKPDVSIVSLHPAGIVRDPVGLWLQVKNLEKARDFVKAGLKVIVLAGGKAAKWWLGYGENVTKWQGSYEYNDKAAQSRRAERLERYASVSLEEKKRGKGTSTSEKQNHKRHGRSLLDTRKGGATVVESLLGVLDSDNAEG